MILTSKQNRDSHNRLRNRVIAFRVSQSEWEFIDAAAKMSGLNKQDYLIARCSNKEIHVQPNPRIAVALKKELKHLVEKMQQYEILPPEFQDELHFATALLNDLYKS